MAGSEAEERIRGKVARNTLQPINLREMFAYDPDTGIITRRRRRARFPPGSVAGYVAGGRYIRIKIGRRSYPAHCIAWALMTGRWPDHDVEHRDLDGLNNRWANLRPCTHSQNMMNRRTPRNNTSGFKGVSLHRASGKWIATVCIDGRNKVVARCDNPEEAHAAYLEASRAEHGEYVRPG